jgi:hypothetical protein
MTSPTIVEKNAIIERIDRYRRRLERRAQQRRLYLVVGAFFAVLALAAAARVALLEGRRPLVVLAALLVGSAVALLRRGPSRAAAARDLDRRLGLADRLHTVATVARETPLTVFLLEDTATRFTAAALGDVLPGPVPRHVWVAAAGALVAGLALQIGARAPVERITRAPVAALVDGSGIAPEPDGRGEPAAGTPAGPGRPRQETAAEASPVHGRPARQLPPVSRRRAENPGTFVPRTVGQAGGQGGGAGEAGGAIGVPDESPLFADRPEPLVAPGESFGLGLAVGPGEDGGGKPGGGARRGAETALRELERPDLTLRRRQAVDDAVWRARIPIEYHDVMRRFFGEESR